MAIPPTTIAQFECNVSPFQYTHHYWHDGQRVYLNKKVIETAEPHSFKLINSMYSRDKKHIFWMGELVEDVNIESFEAIDPSLARDNKRFYYCGVKILFPQKSQINTALLPQMIKDQFLKIANDVYALKSENGLECYAIPLSSDGDNFRCLEHGVTADSTRVYFQKWGFSYADQESYRYFTHFTPNRTDALSVYSENYISDGEALYFNGSPVPGVDLTSVQFLGELVAGDALGLIVAGQRLESSSCEGFRFFREHSNFAEDKHTIFYVEFNIDDKSWQRLHPLTSDKQSFTPIDTDFSKNHMQVFYRHLPIKLADSQSFRALGFGYAKDKNRVYLGEQILEQYDAASFELVNDSLLRDAHGEYAI